MRILLFLAIALLVFESPASAGEYRAGAAVTDVTPQKFPVLVNGGITSRTTSDVVTRINARAIVIADGQQKIGIVVVDSCMMPRTLLDEAKQLAAQQTGLKPDHILISATHTHTAPSSMEALGTDAQADYLPVLRAGIAEALAKAEANLEPAKIGWGVINAEKFTAVRRWILRPDRMLTDPFGNKTARANMHAARNKDDVTGESGPEDPDLTMISVQAIDGRPIAVLSNFSMHYFSGQRPLAADYFGLFCDSMQQQLQHSESDKPAFVGIMSHGCSGDIWRRDYRMPPEQQISHDSIETYSEELLKLAMTAYKDIQYSAAGPVAMAEARPTLKYRTPDAQRLQWAQQIIEELGDGPLKTQEQVYAREQLVLHELQQTEIVVQGIRIGNIGIASTPNETYALTGLKIKHQSPLPQTMVIELANGGDGYIPPPEQHVLGGYNTWEARSAGLEVQAEPKITETALELLEVVAEKARRPYSQKRGASSDRILSAKPVAWWRTDEMAGPLAKDSSGFGRTAMYEPGVAFFLEGPNLAAICPPTQINRAVHFAGGRMLASSVVRGDQYSVAMWIWNGMPTDARSVTGWFYAQGRPFGKKSHGEQVGIGGTSTNPGHLIYSESDSDFVTGPTQLKRWQWNHVVLVRDRTNVRIHLNGRREPEIKAVTSGKLPPEMDWFFGGRSDLENSWEGRLDEIAVFDRALSAEEVADVFAID